MLMYPSPFDILKSHVSLIIEVKLNCTFSTYGPHILKSTQNTHEASFYPIFHNQVLTKSFFFSFFLAHISFFTTNSLNAKRVTKIINRNVGHKFLLASFFKLHWGVGRSIFFLSATDLARHLSTIGKPSEEEQTGRDCNLLSLFVGTRHDTNTRNKGGCLLSRWTQKPHSWIIYGILWISKRGFWIRISFCDSSAHQDVIPDIPNINKSYLGVLWSFSRI